MADQVVARVGMPQTGKRDRRALIPCAPVHHQTCRADFDLQFGRDLERRFARKDLVFSVGPGHLLRAAKLPWSLGLQRLGRLMLGAALMLMRRSSSLYRRAIAQMHAAHPQKSEFRNRYAPVTRAAPDQARVFRHFEQLIGILAAICEPTKSAISQNLEHRAFLGPRFRKPSVPQFCAVVCTRSVRDQGFEAPYSLVMREVREFSP